MNAIACRAAAVTLALTCTLSAPIALADDDGILSYRATTTGWSLPSEEQDVDNVLDDGEGFITTVSGRSNLGPVTSNSVGDVAEWDTVSFCGPNDLLFDYLAATSIIQLKNGDQIFAELDTAQPANFCFNVLDASATFELTQLIVGGTGRFAGASGSLRTEGVSQGLAGQTALTYETKGKIVLAGGAHDDDDDDDEDDDD